MERTLCWLTKRRNLRTRWSKKAENWLALIQLACAMYCSTWRFSVESKRGRVLIHAT